MTEPDRDRVWHDAQGAAWYHLAGAWMAAPFDAEVDKQGRRLTWPELLVRYGSLRIDATTSQRVPWRRPREIEVKAALEAVDQVLRVRGFRERQVAWETASDDRKAAALEAVGRTRAGVAA